MYEFDAKVMKDRIVQWIRDFFAANGDDCKAVVAISGGKDSSVVAGLCVEALGKDRVFGVLLPQGEHADIVCRQTYIYDLRDRKSTRLNSSH